MPELPDVLLYIHALEPRVVGETLEKVRLASPFLLRSVEPPIQECENRKVLGLCRLGKRIVFELEGDLYLVFHLMIAGRFRWRPAQARIPGKLGLAAFDLSSGTLVLTEAGSIKRASLHVVSGAGNLGQHDPGGIEVLECSLEDFRGVLARENHTLKRSLTDPRLVQRHRQRLFRRDPAPRPPVAHEADAPSRRFEEIETLYVAVREVLTGLVPPAPRGDRRRLPREGYGVPAGHGGARPLPGAVSRLRRSRSADPLCSQRVQLLREMPDRRAALG